MLQPTVAWSHLLLQHTIRQGLMESELFYRSSVIIPQIHVCTVEPSNRPDNIIFFRGKLLIFLKVLTYLLNIILVIKRAYYNKIILHDVKKLFTTKYVSRLFSDRRLA